MRTCRICGCTDSRACLTEGKPCRWRTKDLCSACAAKMPAKSFRKPWHLVRIRANPKLGLEEEWSVMEGKVIIGAFDRKHYAEMLLVGRFLVEELAQAEGKEIPDLLQEALVVSRGRLESMKKMKS